MGSEKIIELVNQYFDGELSHSNEAELFNLLSIDKEARDYLRNLYKLRGVIIESTEEFPEELEERIFRNIKSQVLQKQKHTNNHSLGKILSFAAAAILLFISGYLFVKVTSYQKELEGVSRQMMIQAKTIDLLFNSFQTVEVNAKYDNQIIIKPNI